MGKVGSIRTASHISLTFGSRFALRFGCGIEQPWIDVCMGVDKSASSYFRAFLDAYITESKTLRPCLDEREWHEVQTIKQAATLHDVWAMLIRAADLKVISPRKKADPRDGRWNLDYSSRSGSNRNRTLCEIGTVSCNVTLIFNASLMLRTVDIR
jgi:hypothetical protein